MKKKFLLITIAVIVFILCIMIAKANWSILFRNVHCSEKETMNNYEFNGVILEKFNDYENHNYNAIMVNDLKKNKKLKLYFINEKSDFYSLVNLRDTLVKKRNSLVIIDVSQKREFKLLYDCE